MQYSCEDLGPCATGSLQSLGPCDHWVPVFTGARWSLGPLWSLGPPVVTGAPVVCGYWEVG